MDKIKHLLNIPEDLLYVAEISDVQLIVDNTNLCEGVFVTTVDVKLRVFKEDKLYENKLLHTMIPRGCSYVFINNVFVHALYGHPKFGNDGDYLHNSDDKEEYLVFRRKENGECSHWSGFEYQGEMYEMFGSKNVHFIVRSNHFSTDIEKYTKERYAYATKMARNIRNQIKSKEQHERILNYFVESSNTFCAESCFLESQHLVKYENTTALFFAITGRRLDVSDFLVKISPVNADELFMSFGLNVVAETIVVNINDNSRVAEICSYFESQQNSEGAVVYKVDSTMRAIYAYKHKNYDYIFRRALREKMRSKSLTNTIVKRMESLHIKHPNYVEMLETGLKFNAWYRSLSEDIQKHFFEQFVSMEEMFKSIDPSVINQIYATHIENEKLLNVVNVIMFVAIPGSSKSTCAKVLLDILTNLGAKTIHLEQDMFYDKGKGASAAYEKAIASALQTPDVRYILLTKSNHSDVVRNNTYRTFENAFKGAKLTKHINLTYVTITANGDIEKTKEICLDRIMSRGFAHASLYGMSRSQVNKILTDVFVAQYKQLSNEERLNTTIELDIEDDRITNLTNLISQLQFYDVIPAFETTEEMLLNAFAKVSIEDAELALISKAKKDKEIRTIGYDCIFYPNLGDVINQIEELKNEIKLHKLTLKTEFHTTLKYYGKKHENTIDPFEDDVKCVSTIVGYAISDKACAFMVEIPTQYSTQTIPHITLALAKSVNASYSATLLEEALSTDTLIMLETPIKINGFTQRVCVI